MSSGSWVHATVNGHSVEAWAPFSSVPGMAIILFHDLDTVPPSGRADLRPIIETSPVPVICPLAGRCWWLAIPTTEYSEAGPLGWVKSDVVAWIAQTWQVKPPGIGLIGIGMGGNGALNLAYRNARQFPVVAAISAAVDFHRYQASEPKLSEVFESVEAARQETATLHLHPLNWPLSHRIACAPNDPHWFEGCERLASKLDSSGIPFDRDFRTLISGDRNVYDSQQLRISIDFVVRGLPEAGRQLNVV